MRTEALLLAASLTACSSNSGNVGGDGPGSDPVSDGDSCASIVSRAGTLAGDAQAGFVDGTRCVARFHNPVNVAVDPSGNVFVADFDNGKVRLVTSDGTTSTAIAQQNFARPFAMAFAHDGTLYVTTDNDPNNQHSPMSGSVWKVAPGAMTAQPVAVDIGRPRGLFVLSDGRLVATDYENHVVEIIDPSSGKVSPLAGAWGSPGFADGAGTAAKFSSPYGIVQRKDGSLVINDWGNQKLRVVTLTGAVTTMAGSSSGFADGTMSGAMFNHPQGLTIDSSDNLYLTDTDNFRVREISGSTITTIAGDGKGGYVDAADPLQAELYGLEGLAITPDGSKLYVADGTRGDELPFNHVRVIALH
jgi:sugar lactone lactonase YvrE